MRCTVEEHRVNICNYVENTEKCHRNVLFGMLMSIGEERFYCSTPLHCKVLSFSVSNRRNITMWEELMIKASGQCFTFFNSKESD